jgi:hypothetical protein
VAFRSEVVVDDEPTAAVEPVLEPAVDETPGAIALSGADMFLSARKSRRVQLPASRRRGRHGSKDGRGERRARDGRGASSRQLHLVDVDGQAETERIALRRRFEEISAIEPAWNAPSGTELQQSVAG